MRAVSPIVQNVGFQFLRQGVMAGADILAVRLVLKAIGIEGQGICAMAAGWIAVFAFFSGVLRAAFQRFLSAEMGRSEDGRVQAAFSTSFGLSIGGGLLVILLGESVGFYGLMHYLSFPKHMASGVYLVYQLLLLGTALRFLALPHQALAVARERMGILASGGLIESVMQVGLSAALLLIPEGFRMPACAATSILTALVSFGYLAFRMRDLPEVDIRPSVDMVRARPVLAYFGWSLLSSLAGMFRLSGTETFLNRRLGVRFSSSWDVSYRAASFLYVLISGIQQAVEPQLVKRKECGAQEAYLKLTFCASRWLSFLVWLVAFPAFMFASPLVGFWLGAEQPPQIVEFLRVFLVYFMLDALTASVHSAIMSSTRIGYYQTVLAAFGIAGFLLAVVVLLFGASAWMSAAAITFSNAAGCVFRLVYFCRIERVPMRWLIRDLLLPYLAFGVLSVLLFWFL